ncbi:hypothetical protein [Sinorhizobium meliloti]|uniref:hypothetical protein n=1 Tax=Rhizobium meliloti TaxID=382 RepID=UPI0012950B41|nr:hypothetical protein [Sinorhizobium meliloti]MDW9491720.1 hypothetical protein [Sinorhizobium meliloti]MQV02986.1 hypothetical protein [Sinorhizobium meliloti]
MSTRVTKVQISFFKPTGFEDTHFVDTEDRALAATTVMKLYDERMLACMNYITTNHHDQRHLGDRALLEPHVTFQSKVGQWIVDCFGEEVAKSQDERNHRFLEEALELVQSLGATKQECHDLVEYVFDREKGEPAQEVGGVTVCLAALCNAAGLDMEACADSELNRIDNDETKAKIREKHAGKPKFGRFRFRDAGSPWDAAKDMTVEQYRALHEQDWSKILSDEV